MRSLAPDYQYYAGQGHQHRSERLERMGAVTTPRSILLLDFHNFFVFTGRQPLWTVDLFVSEAEGRGKTDPVYTAETVDRLNRAMHLVREHLQASASCASRWYNRKARPR